LSSNDSGLFSFRFVDVHSRTVRDWQRNQFFDVPLGLGDSSVHKTHYPSLRQRLAELERFRAKLQLSEAYLLEVQRLSHTGSFGWRVSTGEVVWSEETFRIFEFDPAIKPTLELVLQRTHPEDRPFVEQFLTQVSHDDKDWHFEHRLLMPDGSVKHLRAVGHATKDTLGKPEFVGAVMDVTAARRAVEQLSQTQAELTRVARITALGELTAAIAHEVNQPLTGVLASGKACLNWLSHETPDLEAARTSLQRVVDDATRAGEVIGRMRALAKNAPSQMDWLNINETIIEIVALVRGQAQRNSVLLRAELLNNLPHIYGDRIQLQQVMLNLLVNGIEAMSGANERRELLVVSKKDDADGVLIEVRDTGAGFDDAALDRIFDAFYTTKFDGTGLGLAISRKIIEAHGGQLRASPNFPRGAIFQFRLPQGREEKRP
jgi:signal transduction histidine kinase